MLETKVYAAQAERAYQLDAITYIIMHDCTHAM